MYHTATNYRGYVMSKDRTLGSIMNNDLVSYILEKVWLVCDRREDVSSRHLVYEEAGVLRILVGQGKDEIEKLVLQLGFQKENTVIFETWALVHPGDGLMVCLSGQMKNDSIFHPFSDISDIGDINAACCLWKPIPLCKKIK